MKNISTNKDKISTNNLKNFSAFSSIVNRMGRTVNFKWKNMPSIAKELGVSTQAVHGFAKKNYIPTETAINWRKRHFVSIDWLLAGKREMLSEDKQGNKDGLRDEKEVEILKDKLIEALTENSALKDRIIALEKKNS